MANYIDKDELQQHFVDWLSVNPDGDNMPDTIGEAILLVAHNTVRRWNFSGYTTDWKEDMVDEAVWNAVRYCRNYEYTKYNNPHAYLTMICFRSFTNIIKKRKKEQERKFEMIVNELEQINCEDQFSEIDSDIMNDFYAKANIGLHTSSSTTQDKVVEWLTSEGGVTDFIDI